MWRQRYACARRASRRRRLLSGCEVYEPRYLLAGEVFSLVAIPDTQFYTESDPATFNAQTQWIADNIAARNIAFVTHLGDVVQNSSNNVEWQRADAAIDLLDGNLAVQPDGLVPYSIAIGNHDFEPIDTHQNAPHFVQNFGAARYQGRSWYGGASANQLNHYQIFSASGFQLLHITLEWEPRASSIEWAQTVLNAHPGLPAILTTHAYLEGGEHSPDNQTSDGLSGIEIFEQFVAVNPQIFMVLNGHFSGETRYIATNRAGSAVIEMNADYQSRANGGDGFLRIIEFRPNDDRIDVFTYSPTLNQFETDADSQFSIAIDFDQRFAALNAPYAALEVPADNSSTDFDPRYSFVRTNLLAPAIEIQLSDTAGGIADSSVVAATLTLSKDGIPLPLGEHYTFQFNAASDRIRLQPQRSAFENGKYEITLNSGAAKIRDQSGVELPLTTFTLDIDTALPSLPTAFYFGISGSISLPGGIASADEDIYYFNGSQFSLYFDGSDVGLAATVVDAFAILSPNVLLLSVRDPIPLPGISETVDDSDIVMFTATSLGATTAGSFLLYFDGSDVDLTSSSEDIDALDLLPDGSLIISTTGSFSVGALAGADEDLLRFIPTSIGSTTAGTYSLWFDGSDVGLSAESVDGAALYGPYDVYLTLTSDFIANGPTIRDDDMFVFSSWSLGETTVGAYRPQLFLDGSSFQLNSGDLLDVHIPVLREPGNHAPDARNDQIFVEAGNTVTTLAGGNDSLQWNDTDIDMPSDHLTVNTVLVQPPQFGSVTLNSDGTFSYTHDGSNTSSDLFFYELTDAMGATDIAAVVITIELNAAPQLVGLPDRTIPQGGSDNSIDLDAYYSDIETPAAQATFDVVESFTGVTVSIDPVTHVLTITPAADFYGQGDITIRVTDTGDSGSPPRSASDTLRVTVTTTVEPSLFFTFYSGFTTSGGLKVANEDIIDWKNSAFSLTLDGSDVGLSSYRVTDFAIISSNEILLVFSGAVTLPGGITADAHDVVKFTASSLGTTTAGTFEIFFDGDDVGLDTASENLDGLEYLANGTLLLSMKSTVSVPGVSARDEDILAFVPSSLGPNTSGTWSLYFDGSDVGLSSYDIDAIAVEPNGNLLLSSDSDFSIPGLTVADEDVFRFIPTSLGPNTAGSFDAILVLDGSEVGLASNELTGIEWAAFSIDGGFEGLAAGEGERATAVPDSQQVRSRNVDGSSNLPPVLAGYLRRLSPRAVDWLMTHENLGKLGVNFFR